MRFLVAGLALSFSLISIPGHADCVRTIYNTSACTWLVDGEVYVGSLTFYKPSCTSRSRRNSKRAARASGFPIKLESEKTAARVSGGLPVLLERGCQFNLKYGDEFHRGYLTFTTSGYQKTVPYAAFLRSCPSIDDSSGSDYINFNSPAGGGATITSCPAQKPSRTKRR